MAKLKSKSAGPSKYAQAEEESDKKRLIKDAKNSSTAGIAANYKKTGKDKFEGIKIKAQKKLTGLKKGLVR